MQLARVEGMESVPTDRSRLKVESCGASPVRCTESENKDKVPALHVGIAERRVCADHRRHSRCKQYQRTGRLGMQETLEGQKQAPRAARDS